MSLSGINSSPSDGMETIERTRGNGNLMRWLWIMMTCPSEYVDVVGLVRLE